MAVHRLDHINLRASGSGFAALRDFYCRIVGLTIGARPPLQSEGLWLYAGDAAIVHLVDAPQASSEAPGASHAGTALDHMAFACSDLEQVLGRLGAMSVAHTVQVQAVTGQTLVRLEDPCGLRVELVFEPPDRQALPQRCWGA